MFKRYTGTHWGAWLRDSYPANHTMAKRYWFTRHFTGKLLYEYNSARHFIQDRVSTYYKLPELYFGTGHVVYKGALIYHRAGFREIFKYDLDRKEVSAKNIVPNAAYQGRQYLYITEYNYFDFSVDENGLWVIYGEDHKPMNLMVSKLNSDLSIEKTWRITVHHKQYGNGFIACGVLYLIKNTRTKDTVIDFAFDLYEDRRISVRIPFTNPFEMNNMVSYYFHGEKAYILTWDKGNQLTYPLREV